MGSNVEGSAIARSHANIQIDTALLIAKLLARLAQKVREMLEHYQRNASLDNKPLEMNASIDDHTFLTAQVDQNLLPGRDPPLLQGKGQNLSISPPPVPLPSSAANVFQSYRVEPDKLNGGINGIRSINPREIDLMLALPEGSKLTEETPKLTIYDNQGNIFYATQNGLVLTNSLQEDWTPEVEPGTYVKDEGDKVKREQTTNAIAPYASETTKHPAIETVDEQEADRAINTIARYALEHEKTLEMLDSYAPGPNGSIAQDTRFMMIRADGKEVVSLAVRPTQRQVAVFGKDPTFNQDKALDLIKLMERSPSSPHQSNYYQNVEIVTYSNEPIVTFSNNMVFDNQLRQCPQLSKQAIENISTSLLHFSKGDDVTLPTSLEYDNYLFEYHKGGIQIYDNKDIQQKKLFSSQSGDRENYLERQHYDDLLALRNTLNTYRLNSQEKQPSYER